MSNDVYMRPRSRGRSQSRRAGVPPTPRQRSGSSGSAGGRNVRRRLFGGGRGRSRTRNTGPYVRTGRGPIVRARGSQRRRAARALRRRRPARRPRRSTNPYNRLGSTKNAETGGVYSVSTSSALYVGHSVGPNEVAAAVCRAIIKELFRQKGEHIQRWFDKPLNTTVSAPGLIVWSYWSKPTSTTATEVTVGFDNTMTYDAIATALNASLNVVISGDSFTLNQVWLAVADTDGGYHTDALISCQQFTLHLYCKSNLKIQNCSKGGIVASPDNDVDEMEIDITNNPLKGKEYISKKWQNGFLPLARQRLVDTNYKSFIGDWISGVILAKGTENSSPDFVKPPPAFAFQNTTAKPFSIAPGAVKTSKFVWKTKMGLNKMMAEYWFLINRVAKEDIKLGYAKMFGFEKMIDGRAGEYDISVQWELNSTYACYGVQRPTISLPINVVGT